METVFVFLKGIIAHIAEAACGTGDIMSLVSDDMNDLLMDVEQARMGLGSSLLSKGQYESAIIAYQSVLQISPGNDEAKRGLAEAQKGTALQPLDLHTWPQAGITTQLPDILKTHIGVEAPVPTSPGQCSADGSPRGCEEFNVVFSAEGSIGILFEAANSRAPVVIAAIEDGSPASKDPRLFIGQILTAVRGTPVEGFPFSSTQQLLSNKARPLALSFRSELPPTELMATHTMF
eukprot:SAG11_NODE_7218_length_1176_cov_2.871866_1_plen_233_part_10